MGHLCSPQVRLRFIGFAVKNISAICVCLWNILIIDGFYNFYDTRLFKYNNLAKIRSSVVALAAIWKSRGNVPPSPLLMQLVYATEFIKTEHLVILLDSPSREGNYIGNICINLIYLHFPASRTKSIKTRTKQLYYQGKKKFFLQP